MAASRRFLGKAAIVTGAASGIGLACAQRLCSEGARVVVADLDEARARAAAAQAEAAAAGSGGRALGLACDVADEAQVVACVQRCRDEFGGLHVVVNNAGRMIFKPLEQHTAEDMRDVFAVDLMGAFYFTKQAFLHMADGGAVVNVSSVHAEQTTPMVTAYAAAKAALLSLTRSASLEGKSRGIRVNAVLPGAVDTPMLHDNPNIRSGVEQLHPADIGRPEDIAAAIAFLASDEARFVEGAALRVDGGRLDLL